MRTLPAAQSDAPWATRIEWNAHDLRDRGAAGHGLVVHADEFDEASGAGLLSILDLPTVDRIDVSTAIDPAHLALAIALLRECRSRDIDVHLDLGDASMFDVELDACRHLTEPRPAGPLRFDVYRRHGPGFVQVVDDRPDRHLRVTFDDADDIAVIERLDLPVDARTVDSAQLEMFEEFKLLVRIADAVVGVVPRIKTWPVPIDDLFAPPTA